MFSSAQAFPTNLEDGDLLYNVTDWLSVLLPSKQQKYTHSYQEHIHVYVYRGAIKITCLCLCTQKFRGKIQDLNSEIAQMSQEIETYNQESATYLTFEKRCVDQSLQ